MKVQFLTIQIPFRAIASVHPEANDRSEEHLQAAPCVELMEQF